MSVRFEWLSLRAPNVFDQQFSLRDLSLVRLDSTDYPKDSPMQPRTPPSTRLAKSSRVIRAWFKFTMKTPGVART